MAILTFAQVLVTTVSDNFFKKMSKFEENIVFCFFEKKKKNLFWLNFFLQVTFRGTRPMEDNLANNFTSLHFPDACVTSI